jgi:hypothetical protein
MRGVAARLLLVIGSTALAMLLLEGVLRVLPSGRTPVGRFPNPYDTTPDPDLGYRLKPSSRFHAVKLRDNGNACYDVVYTTDAFGRRIVDTPPRAAEAPQPRLVLFGCSYTLGEGLADEETLQFKLGRRFDVINYAAHGYGPQHTLALLRGDRPRRELPEGEARGLYVLYPFHLARAVVTSDQAHVAYSPYFELGADATLRQYASFASRRPLRARIYRLLTSLKEHSMLFHRLRVYWPLLPDPQRAQLTAAILIDAAHRFEERWGPFVVAVHGTNVDTQAVQQLIDRLRAANVAVLDYSRLTYSHADQIDPNCDTHPNGRFTTRLAERLESDLLALQP